MVGGHLALAQPLREQVRHPLGQAPRVDEDERRPVGPHVGRDAVQDLAPLLLGRDGLQLAVRQLDREVEAAAVAEVDDAARRPAVGPAAPLAGPDQEARDRLDRPLGGGEPDALRAAAWPARPGARA